jgi:hypothetical protein
MSLPVIGSFKSQRQGKRTSFTERAILSPLRLFRRPILLISPCCDVFCSVKNFLILSIAFLRFSSSEEVIYKSGGAIRIGILYVAYVFKTLL